MYLKTDSCSYRRQKLTSKSLKKLLIHSTLNPRLNSNCFQFIIMSVCIQYAFYSEGVLGDANITSTRFARIGPRCFVVKRSEKKGYLSLIHYAISIVFSSKFHQNDPFLIGYFEDIEMCHA